MKSLKNKIFAGALTLASLGFFGEKNVSAQSADSLNIKTLIANKGEIDQMTYAEGYYNKELTAFLGCNSYNKVGGHYTKMTIYSGHNLTKHEIFIIDYSNGLINYELYSGNPYYKLAEFKNLTIEQIDQDTAFAERTKRIINACGSAENLREMVKEIYKENGEIKIPNIKQ